MTSNELSKKILKMEHEIYPKVITMFARKKIVLKKKFIKSKKESAYLILFSAVLGFFIYVLSEYIYSLGTADKIPSLLASLSPAIITNMMAIYFIFHFDNVK